MNKCQSNMPSPITLLPYREKSTQVTPFMFKQMGEYTDKTNQAADMTSIVYNKEYLIDGDYLLMGELKIPLH